MTYGETLDEARAMAADAIEGYLECLEEDGLPLPESDPVAVPPLVDQIRIVMIVQNFEQSDIAWHPSPRAAWTEPTLGASK